MAEKVVIGSAELWHGDCREVLPLLPLHDLLLTDPPYGIDFLNGAGGGRKEGQGGWATYERLAWDKERPPPWMFGLMREKSKELVVWGGNYFADLLPASMCWLVWDKGQTDFSLADCELAWSSHQSAVRRLTLTRSEAMKDGKEHPTQKPVRLMVWCLEKHPKAKTVCDPYMGSGTTGVACAQLGKAFTGIERERKYFDLACERISRAQAQGSLIPLDPTPVATQQVMEL